MNTDIIKINYCMYLLYYIMYILLHILCTMYVQRDVCLCSTYGFASACYVLILISVVIIIFSLKPFPQKSFLIQFSDTMGAILILIVIIIIIIVPNIINYFSTCDIYTHITYSCISL